MYDLPMWLQVLILVAMVYIVADAVVYYRQMARRERQTGRQPKGQREPFWTQR